MGVCMYAFEGQLVSVLHSTLTPRCQLQKHWRVHLSFGFPILQMNPSIPELEQRQLFLMSARTKQSFYHRAHAFVI